LPQSEAWAIVQNQKHVALADQLPMLERDANSEIICAIGTGYELETEFSVSPSQSALNKDYH
jgi:hypothetical protein